MAIIKKHIMSPKVPKCPNIYTNKTCLIVALILRAKQASNESLSLNVDTMSNNVAMKCEMYIHGLDLPSSLTIRKYSLTLFDSPQHNTL